MRTLSYHLKVVDVEKNKYALFNAENNKRLNLPYNYQNWEIYVESNNLIVKNNNIKQDKNRWRFPIVEGYIYLNDVKDSSTSFAYFREKEMIDFLKKFSIRSLKKEDPNKKYFIKKNKDGFMDSIETDGEVSLEKTAKSDDGEEYAIVNVKNATFAIYTTSNDRIMLSREDRNEIIEKSNNMSLFRLEDNMEISEKSEAVINLKETESRSL